MLGLWKFYKDFKQDVSFTKIHRPGLFSVRPSSEGILLVDDKILSEIEGQRQRLEMQQKKLKEAQEKEKDEKIERMKQGSAENMPDNSGSKTTL